MEVSILTKLYLITFLVPCVRSQIFTLPHKMAVLFYYEEDILRFLLLAQSISSHEQVQDYIASCQPRLEEVPSLGSTKEQMEKENHLEMILEILVGNPVHLYSLVERLVRQLPAIRKTLAEDMKTADIAEGINKMLENVDLVWEEDLVGVTQALARIQFAYRLDPVDLASGILLTVATSARLTSAQMMAIAHSCYSGKNPIRPGVGKEYALAIEWAEGADKISIDQHGSFSFNYRKEFLKRARIVHDRNWRNPIGQRGVLPNEEVFVTKILNDDGITKSGQELRKEEKVFLQSEPQVRDLSSGFNIHDFYAICRGDTLNQTKPLKDPKCYSTTLNDPYFLLAPLQLEILSDDPQIHIFHQILTNQEMDFMTTRVMAQLKAATIQDLSVPNGGGQKISNERTQSSGWMWDQEDDLLYKLSKRITRIVKLETFRPPKDMVPGTKWAFVEAEPWQMGVYGPGGHYLPHWDSFDILDPQSIGPGGVWVGNRMATLMFYLSNVLGGFTAFNRVGVAARPSRGDGVFWYNLQRDGGRKDGSMHGACPTVLGIKWVSNKWIREGAQVWRRPCI